jgi:hypothetical protein
VAVLGVAAAAFLAGCGSDVDSGGLSAGDRNAAQAAMDALQQSNIPRQLVNFTSTAGLAPATCRIRLESRSPHTFRVYIFWIPYVGSQSYIWLDMKLAEDTARDRFHVGTEAPVLPSGTLSPDRKTVAPGSLDYDTPLARYGPRQAERNRRVLMAHGGNVFSKPGAKCQVLQNGYLRLVPNG